MSDLQVIEGAAVSHNTFSALEKFLQSFNIAHLDKATTVFDDSKVPMYSYTCVEVASETRRLCDVRVKS